MKKKQIQPKLLLELERTPIISVACEKVGISRQTAYRWMQEDTSFLTKVEEAMEHGVGLVNDVAESNILRGIKENNLAATKFWLDRRHASFKKPFIHRLAGLDLLEQKRIEDYIQRETGRDSKSEEEKRVAKAKVRKMLDKWFPPQKPTKEKE